VTSAQEALEGLIAGNRRFVADAHERSVVTTAARRAQLVGGQSPRAVILGCADSRVPSEIVFDQGLGDLFVTRVAGNIAAPSQVGSIEYAVEQLGTRLVVVLGHSNCGAVQATIDALEQRHGSGSSNLDLIVDHIRPAVQAVLEQRADLPARELMQLAVRANVTIAANQLRQHAALLQPHLASAELLIVGAQYSLETGAVEFFDGVPETH
jgi:carbonic anhydrase